jgi:hypothetical protein
MTFASRWSEVSKENDHDGERPFPSAGAPLINAEILFSQPEPGQLADDGYIETNRRGFLIMPAFLRLFHLKKATRPARFVCWRRLYHRFWHPCRRLFGSCVCTSRSLDAQSKLPEVRRLISPAQPAAARLRDPKHSTILLFLQASARVACAAALSTPARKGAEARCNHSKRSLFICTLRPCGSGLHPLRRTSLRSESHRLRSAAAPHGSRQAGHVPRPAAQRAPSYKWRWRGCARGR